MAQGPVFFLCGQRWSLKSLTLFSAALIIITNEFLIYVVQSLRWPTLPVNSRDPAQTQVILLVSDPQIQGFQDEPGFPLGNIIRWDSDRFLTQTFGLAYAYSQPDVVVFLGDLMDEGSKATKEEYKDYYYRFLQIFSAAGKNKKIYIAGDNDIGGENRDRRTEKKMDRFEKHFDLLTGVDTFGFIDYIKMDLETHGMPFLPKRDLADDLKKKLSSKLHILVSHETVMAKQKVELYPLLRRLRPHLVLSGHWHKSAVFVCDDCMVDDEEHWSVHRRDLGWMKGYMSVNITISEHALTEVMVPTCSYRMGEDNMGYGVAVIESTGQLKYAVLWSPQRYLVLYSYILFFISVILGNIFFKIVPRRRR